MGIQAWFSKLRKQEDAEAVSDAQEAASGEPEQEQEVWTGDVEGLAADRAAAERLSGGLKSDFDPPKW